MLLSRLGCLPGHDELNLVVFMRPRDMLYHVNYLVKQVYCSLNKC